MSGQLPAVDRNVEVAFEEEGWVVLVDVLSTSVVSRARAELRVAAEASERRGIPTRMGYLDPGGHNIRVHDLIEYSPVFADLVTHPTVIPYVSHFLDRDLSVSNFSANIALLGSRSMTAHSDQSTMMPEAWPTRFTMNAIWCLDDTDETNGATRYLPGSQEILCFADVPEDPKASMRPFEATAGSVILMDGRLWHTSGENTTTDRARALLRLLRQVVPAASEQLGPVAVQGVETAARPTIEAVARARGREHGPRHLSRQLLMQGRLLTRHDADLIASTGPPPPGPARIRRTSVGLPENGRARHRRLSDQRLIR